VVETLLDGADVVAILQQPGGEGLPEGMACAGLGAPGGAARLLHRPLEEGFVHAGAGALVGDAAVHVLVELGLSIRTMAVRPIDERLGRGTGLIGGSGRSRALR